MINTATSESVTHFQPMNNDNRIKEYRQRANLSQKQLAEKIHVTRQTIGSWEKGTTTPSVRYLDRLCGALGSYSYELYPHLP